MTSQRIERIKRFFHCNGNENIYTDFPDKIFKIRSLIDALKERFYLLVPTQLLCIDEQKSIDAQTIQSAYAKEMGLQVLCPDKFMSRCSDLQF